jgi:hypothetical protein
MSEPKAWFYENDEIKGVSLYKENLYEDAIPLYTHPPTEDYSLTAEEIINFIFKFFNLDPDTELTDDFWVKYEDLIDFAKELNGVKKK